MTFFLKKIESPSWTKLGMALLLTCISLNAKSEIQQEESIDFKKIFTEIPRTSFEGLKLGFSKESIPWWGGIIGSSLILINNDEMILREFQKFGRDSGIGNEDKTKAALTSGQIDIIRLPTDTGSMMYFLGDGWMHFGIAGGFAANGFFNDNHRALNTGLKIMHGMAVSTMFNQFAKRSFGRESPYVKTQDGGRWSPYPSVAEYQQRTSRYDAMPSGHIMTATLTFTIINDNYPEYSNYIIPLEVTWLSLLGFQMVNNGVHWFSDYPLGIAMGYVFAKAAGNLGKPISDSGASNKTSWMLLPFADSNSSGLALHLQF